VSQQNTAGDITNSDLELAALVYGAAILRLTYGDSTTALQCTSDNAAAVAWATTGSTSSTASRVYILRWLANLTRSLNFTLTPVFAAGSINTLADFCSHSFHLSDQEFYHAIHSQFPIKGGWRVVLPPNDLVLNLTSALSSIMLPWASLAPAPMHPAILGPYGKPSAVPSPSTPTHPTCPTPPQFFKSLLTATDRASYLPANLRFVAARWATPFAPLARRWPTWDTPIHG
jgi:hypothetical protein